VKERLRNFEVMGRYQRFVGLRVPTTKVEDVLTVVKEGLCRRGFASSVCLNRI
jgi:hypothetical protein